MKTKKNKKKYTYIVVGISLIALILLSIKGYNSLVYRFGLYHWKIFNPSNEFISASYQGKDYDFHVYGLNSLHKAFLPKQCLNIMITNAGAYAESTFGFIYSVDDYTGVPKPEKFHDLMAEINNISMRNTNQWNSQSFITIAPNGFFGSTGPNTVHMEETGIILLNQVISKIKKQYGYSHICAHGISIAAQIVAGLLTKRKDIVCAVMVATPYARRKSLKKTKEPDFRQRLHNSIDIYNAANHVNEMNFFPKQKLFLFHDPHDKIVPIYNAREMYKALKKLGANISLVEEENLDKINHHSFLRYHGIDKLTDCAFKFSNKENPKKKTIFKDTAKEINLEN